MGHGAMLSSQLIAPLGRFILYFQTVIRPAFRQLLILVDNTGITFFTHPAIKDPMVGNLKKRPAMTLAGSFCVRKNLCQVLPFPKMEIGIKGS